MDRTTPHINQHEQELIDFCYSELGTTVGTNTTFRDDYPPSNLISSSKEIKERGFIAERFIRPPISITLHFKAPIFLSHISFNTDVGQGHRSTIFDVLVGSYPENVQNLDFVQIGRANLLHLNQFDLSTRSTSIEKDVSKQCVMKNFRFPGNNNEERNYSEASNESPRVFRLNNQENILKSVTHVKINIIKTIGVNSSPAISNLKIFGRVSFAYKACNISQLTINELLKNWEKIKTYPKENNVTKVRSQLSFFQSNIDDKSPTDNSNNSPNSSTSISKTEILGLESAPKEFFDSLTLTLMDVPMVLPSGQHVDRKNIDKYIDSEAKFGRKPNDPFTGRSFTETSYPIFDGKLKSRIDEYVLNKNGISIKEIREKRKLENKSLVNLNNKQFKNDVIIQSENSCKEIKIGKQKSAEKSKKSVPTASESTQQLHLKHKEHKNVTYEDVEIPNIQVSANEQPISRVDEIYQKVLSGRKQIIKTDKNDSSASSSGLNLSTCSTADKCKESEKHTTLIQPHKIARTNDIKCDSCCNSDGNNYSHTNLSDKKSGYTSSAKERHLYRLESCEHIFCRDCLEHINFEQGIATCSQCSKQFMKSQIVKYHPPL